MWQKYFKVGILLHRWMGRHIKNHKGGNKKKNTANKFPLIPGSSMSPRLF